MKTFIQKLKKLIWRKRIVGVAIKENSSLWVMTAPWRHGHVIQLMVKRGCKIPVVGEQGFILNNGEFISREKGLILAKRNGQFFRDCSPGSDQLFSENIW